MNLRCHIKVRYSMSCTLLGMMLAASGCGGRSNLGTQPISLSVSISDSTITVPANGMPVGVPVMIMAPTETATFSILGLPAGVTWAYKESESNPSGLLTLVANSHALPGTYKTTITVGSSGQIASVSFSLVISASTKANSMSLSEGNHRD